jgi:hypothetical protein
VPIYRYVRLSLDTLFPIHNFQCLSLQPNISYMSLRYVLNICIDSGVPRNFFRGRGEVVQQMQLRTEDRENGDLGAVAP